MPRQPLGEPRAGSRAPARPQMENLPLSWDDIAEHLRGVPDLDPAGLARYFAEGPGAFGIHFFHIRYTPGEVIMAKGTTSDYVAVHLQGRIHVRNTESPRQ